MKNIMGFIRDLWIIVLIVWFICFFEVCLGKDCKTNIEKFQTIIDRNYNGN